jgi:hypothetical protein
VATRFDIERAVLASTLPPGCRHLMHVLCVRIDAEAGLILPSYQPSLTDLARDTGRNRRTIMRYLDVLEYRGWVIRTRPATQLARQLHRRTQYALPFPPLYPQAANELGAPGSQARDTTAPGLGTPDPEARGVAAHRSSVSSGSSEELAAVTKAIADTTGVTVSSEWAERVRVQILGNRTVRHPQAYLRKVIRKAPPGTYLPPDRAREARMYQETFRTPA